MGMAFKWLAILGRMGNHYVDLQLKELNINSSHHALLIHICKHPGITQDKLRSTVYVHPSNITRALEYLEKEGYLTKEPLETDKRTSRIYPTTKAQAARTHILKAVSDWEALILGDMTQADAERFTQMLEKAGIQATKHFYDY